MIRIQTSLFFSWWCALGWMVSSVAASGQEAPRVTYSLSGGDVTYLLKHKLHEVKGVAALAKGSVLEGRARLMADQGVQVMVRAAVQGFDSGNANRDQHMQEVMEAARHPFVTLKAVLERVDLPTTFPAQTTHLLKGQITLHGVTAPLQTPVTLEWQSAQSVTLRTRFTVSLEAFQIERPSLLMVKVDDRLEITAALTWQPMPLGGAPR